MRTAKGSRARGTGSLHGVHPSTVGELIKYGTRRFLGARLVYGHGTTAAAQEAAYLVAHALRVRPDRLHTRLAAAPSPSQLGRALDLISARIALRQPAAYLVHEAWLGTRRFYVDDRVIVPRSHIAEMLRDDLAPWIKEPGKIATALDLGTGSGCLAVLLAHSFRRARIDAIDISQAALAVARTNVRRYRLQARIRLLESDLFSAIRGVRYDLIVSNPPYVTTASMRRLPAEYRHEPRLALAAGRDGLTIVRRIIRQARSHLKPGGLLVVEVGGGRRRVEQAFSGIEFVWPQTTAGHPVFVVWREQLPVP
ncbi:MAG TPA: 50S ribosomal protein L3 N(5)-glutamine methyltransferase [Burkholderiales bacterium]|nr:50S ribosomal protein L3 N(5)-glutamine methyltransferase [Burkholderiales bacterium]